MLCVCHTTTTETVFCLHVFARLDHCDGEGELLGPKDTASRFKVLQSFDY